MYTSQIYRSVTQVNEAMSRVYFYMMTAVLNSMLVSYFVSQNDALMQVLFTTSLKWVVLLAPLALAFIIPTVIEGATKQLAQVYLHVFAAVMGLSLSIIFKVYTGMSIFSAFIGAAVLFGTMSLYGYFTKNSKESMDSIGKYCMIALIAIIITSIINLFIGSSLLTMAISAVAIVIFMAFTAYDTYTIREIVSVDTNPAIEVMGALNLYLDFINLFINLLQLFGDKDD